MEFQSRPVLRFANARFGRAVGVSCSHVRFCQPSISALQSRHQRQPVQTRNFRLHTVLLRQELRPTGDIRNPDPSPAPTRGTSKLFKSADEAVADIKSGSTILSAGFGLCGTAGGTYLDYLLSRDLVPYVKQKRLSMPCTEEESNP